MDALRTIIDLTRMLGEPQRDLAILGEGNTSIRVDDETFLVKASGMNFARADADTFVAVRFAPVLALLERPAVDEEELKAVYAEAKVDPSDERRPSVETIFHACLLSQPGIGVVAHTHPAVVNGLTCSQSWPDCCAGRLFPDEAVVCGPEAVLIPYMDPGVELAKAIRAGCEAHRQRHGVAPRQILMQNHGLIACGADAREAAAVTDMAVKAARIRAGALAAGGIHALGDEVTGQLLARPDEQYRQRLWEQERSAAGG